MTAYSRFWLAQALIVGGVLLMMVTGSAKQYGLKLPLWVELPAVVGFFALMLIGMLLFARVDSRGLSRPEDRQLWQRQPIFPAGLLVMCSYVLFLFVAGDWTGWSAKQSGQVGIRLMMSLLIVNAIGNVWRHRH